MADPVSARPFGVQFGEAIDYLKGKLPEGTLRSDDLAGPVHGKVFTIAGAVKTDLVGDLHQSLIKRLETGTTITDFRKDFDKAVAEHGWSYNGKRGWRTQVIFGNNMRSAHMAGRWDQLQANKDRRPFLQYRTAGDSRVRPLHRQWNGMIYPIDDVFWQTHYPPNGWGCRCTVRAYAQADMVEKNLQVSEPFKMKEREVITRDGEIKDKVPVGIDPGWDHNVGQSWIAPELALGQKIARLPRPLQGIVTDKAITPAFQTVMNDSFKAFRTAFKGAAVPTNAAQIVGFLDSSTLTAVAKQVPTLQLDSTAVAVLDRKALQLEKIAAGAPASPKPWPEDWIDTLPERFRDYQAVLWDKTAEAFVVVPQGTFVQDKLPTIVIKPNAKTNLGSAGNVQSLSSARPADLVDAERFELLVGRVGK